MLRAQSMLAIVTLSATLPHVGMDTVQLVSRSTCGAEVAPLTATRGSIVQHAYCFAMDRLLPRPLAPLLMDSQTVLRAPGLITTFSAVAMYLSVAGAAAEAVDVGASWVLKNMHTHGTATKQFMIL